MRYGVLLCIILNSYGLSALRAAHGLRPCLGAARHFLSRLSQRVPVKASYLGRP